MAGSVPYPAAVSMKFTPKSIDTANAYGTETIVGKAIKDMPRDQVVISTKHHAIW
jgi:diketogulonate reductase-like aldo/keto reductase